MELKQLRQFVAIAEAGSFVKAAQVIGLAQPPLSVSIRKLEVELGTPLFERHGRGATLTAAGEKMFGRARDILAREAGLRTFMRELTSGARATLRIGFVGSATFSLLPRLMQIFRDVHPLVNLELVETTTREALLQVESGVLQVGIVRTPLTEATRLDILPVERDRLVLMAPPESGVDTRCIARLEDFANEAFVMYDRDLVPNLRAVANNACIAAGFVPRVVQQGTQAQSLIALVESGFGYALIPSVLASRVVTHASAHAVTAAGADVQIGLALAVSPDFPTQATTWFCEAAIRMQGGPAPDQI